MVARAARARSPGTRRLHRRRRFGYLSELAKTYWPWLPLAVVGLWLTARAAFTRRDATADDTFPDAASARLLLLWPLVVIGVLSFAHEKKLWYVMSAFPALALLSARALAALGAQRCRACTRRRWRGSRSSVRRARCSRSPRSAVRRRRRPDLQIMARAARTMVPEQSRILFAGGSYFSVAHQFIFYSDRTLVDADADPAAVRTALDAGEWALTSRDGYVRVAGPDSLRYPAVLSSGQWRLVHAAPAPAVRLDPTLVSD